MSTTSPAQTPLPGSARNPQQAIALASSFDCLEVKVMLATVPTPPVAIEKAEAPTEDPCEDFARLAVSGAFGGAWASYQTATSGVGPVNFNFRIPNVNLWLPPVLKGTFRGKHASADLVVSTGDIGRALVIWSGATAFDFTAGAPALVDFSGTLELAASRGGALRLELAVVVFGEYHDDSKHLCPRARLTLEATLPLTVEPLPATAP